MKNSLVKEAMPPQTEFSRRLKSIRAKMEDRGIDVRIFLYPFYYRTLDGLSISRKLM